MVALVVTLGLVVALLGVLVAGLLRSHADILRALHELGAGVGDPALDPGHRLHPDGGATTGPLTIGPRLPPERDSTSAPTIAGVTPAGDARAVAVGTSGRFTLVAFLSSGCSTCAGFWADFRRPAALGLPPAVELLVVTKGPEFELPGELAGRAAPEVPVVMSTEAWTEYEVPGSPFFVLVDGATGRRIGEGVANRVDQVADLVRRALVDAGHDPGAAAVPPAPGRPAPPPLDGPARERANDTVLRQAGIHPGDPSLYPGSLEDLYGPRDGSGRPVPR